jgi:hypothetical protein
LQVLLTISHIRWTAQWLATIETAVGTFLAVSFGFALAGHTQGRRAA